MNKVVGVTFNKNSKVYFFNSNGINLKNGDYVIVETERSFQFGTVALYEIKNKELTDNMKNIIRIANNKDLQIHKKNLEDAVLALSKAKKIAERLNLNMNIMDASFTFDRNQLLFYFLADSRIDFRDMAKELASIYKTRIELRQIGVRDKAKEISGIGPCGRELCCSCFLNNFIDTVSINMAKNQNLALNPSKINGQCGRLLCCLNYEDDVYTENRKFMPEIGDEIMTEKGKGKVISIDILKKHCIVNVPDEGKIEVSMENKCNKCNECNK